MCCDWGGTSRCPAPPLRLHRWRHTRAIIMACLRLLADQVRVHRGTGVLSTSTKSQTSSLVRCFPLRRSVDARVVLACGRDCPLIAHIALDVPAACSRAATCRCTAPRAPRRRRACVRATSQSATTLTRPTPRAWTRFCVRWATTASAACCSSARRAASAPRRACRRRRARACAPLATTAPTARRPPRSSSAVEWTSGAPRALAGPRSVPRPRRRVSLCRTPFPNAAVHTRACSVQSVHTGLTFGAAGGTGAHYTSSLLPAHDESGLTLSTRAQEEECPKGHYCVGGVRYRCPAGRYGATVGMSLQSCTGECSEGYYCPEGSVEPQQFKCGTDDVYCPAGSGCVLCTAPHRTAPRCESRVRSLLLPLVDVGTAVFSCAVSRRRCRRVTTRSARPSSPSTPRRRATRAGGARAACATCATLDSMVPRWP